MDEWGCESNPNHGELYFKNCLMRLVEGVSAGWGGGWGGCGGGGGVGGGFGVGGLDGVWEVGGGDEKFG